LVTLFLPFPPSVNAAYANRKFGSGKGRFKSKVYKDWLAEADAAFLRQKAKGTTGRPIVGPYEVHMTFSIDRRRWNSDVDNRVKVCSDALKRFGLIEDDRKCEKLTATWGPVDGVFLRAFKYLDTSGSDSSKIT
jgi:Holliday junction resolvase RusA-like endonuclease